LTEIQLLLAICSYGQALPQSTGDQSAPYVIATETPEQHGKFLTTEQKRPEEKLSFWIINGFVTPLLL
jgi:hypothetical protein